MPVKYDQMIIADSENLGQRSSQRQPRFAFKDKSSNQEYDLSYRNHDLIAIFGAERNHS